MSRTNKSLPGLFRGKAPTDLIGPGAARSGAHAGKVSRIAGLRALSMGSKEIPAGIQFGSPSNPNASGAAPGSNWEKLLTQTASRGLSSAMKGTISLTDLGGIGTAISSLFKIFGGRSSEKTLPPLVEFALPNPVSQTVYIGSGTANAATQASGTQIAQAVKQALLTSSSLNDVISEI